MVKSLMDAVEAAKQINYKRMINPRIVPLAWYQSAWEEQQELLGPDPWSYGLTEINRKNLETMAGYVHQQGMTGKLMPLEELFPHGAFGWSVDPNSGS